jgi:hypothetical protein
MSVYDGFAPKRVLSAVLKLGVEVLNGALEGLPGLPGSRAQRFAPQREG